MQTHLAVKLTLSLHDQTVEVRFPQSIAADVECLFPTSMMTSAAAQSSVTIHERNDRYAVFSSDAPSEFDVPRAVVPLRLMEEVTRALITRLDTAVALHAAAVGCQGTSILMPGMSGSGKTSLVAWLLDNGFDYLTDEVAVLTDANAILGLPRALVIKPGAAQSVRAFSIFDQAKLVECDSHLLGLPAGVKIDSGARTVNFMIFPKYEAGAEVKIEALTAGEAGLKLVACNLNARNLKDGGFEAIAALSRRAPAIVLRYGGFDQLKGTLDAIIGIAIENRFTAAELRRLLDSFVGAKESAPFSAKRYPVQVATPGKRTKVKLTVGMPSYDDYDGAYFSLQALRLYHRDVLEDVELLVIDNHPDGPCGEALKRLENSIPNYRYVPKNSRYGTAAKEHVFEEAAGEFVLCIDSHVFLVPAALRRLLDYFDAHCGASDLLQGPLLGDDLTTISTHFHPEWRGGMFGYWALDERGKDPDGPPFEIPMQGMGLFACRKAAWPGFNPHFRGFGGEEGYIHEKFRQRGGKTLCLPFLRWVHRFNRPMGVPYHNSWDDRIRNYVIGFRELGLATDEIESHFITLLGPAVAGPIFRSIRLAQGYASADKAPSVRSISTACSIS
jgi:hypothetical protein